MTSTELIEKLKSFALTQLENNKASLPILGFIEPLLKRAINKNHSKALKMLDYLSDENGNIDIENIITEITENLLSSKPFSIEVPILGRVNIGEGMIKVGIPYTTKELAFDSQDLLAFKETLIETKN